jgi:hypothetical protein
MEVSTVGMRVRRCPTRRVRLAGAASKDETSRLQRPQVTARGQSVRVDLVKHHSSCALCARPTDDSVVRLEVDGSERHAEVSVHGSCVTALLRAAIPPVASNLGRIPTEAACGVCGARLPIIGRHPYALTLREPAPGRTWYVHAECFPDLLRERIGNLGRGRS